VTVGTEMMSSRARLACALTLAVAGVVTIGCGGITSPSNNTVEPFSGTLTPQGPPLGHFFNVPKTGEYTVKLTALAPTSNALVGLALTAGNNDNTCSSSVFQQNNFSSLNVQALGGQIISGKYCAVIYDVGTITVAQTYTISVSHP
jgi:hypothetical protein